MYVSILIYQQINIGINVIDIKLSISYVFQRVNLRGLG